MNSNVSYMRDEIVRKLVGWKIVKAVTDRDGESFGFEIQAGKKTKVVWVDCDEEANGPGWLNIEEKT